MAVLSAVEAKVWLFYLKSSRGSLSFNVVREICSYFEDPRFFAAISQESMELHDFITHTTTPHQLPTIVQSGYIQVDRNTVLIVGYEVMKLDLLTFQATPLVPLLTHRNCVGVAQVDKTVFAFGGSNGVPMTVCEKCSLSPTHWIPLSPTHYAKTCFISCTARGIL